MRLPIPCRAVLLAAFAFGALAQQPADPDASLRKDFLKRVSDYVKLRNAARENKLKPTPEPGVIEEHEHHLAHRIREARHGAQQGDVFTPEIAALFRRLIGKVTQGPEGVKLRASLARAEPVHLPALRVNHSYPAGVPLQSTPPTLLLDLPVLPPEVDYRVVGNSLVLRDVGANLIVDYIPNAISR